MVGILRLDHDLAGQIGAPGPPGDLHQLGEQAFRCPAIGGEQRCVGTKHADQCQLREIVPLGQHLGPDQDVGIAAMDSGQHGFPLPAALDRVAVHAQHAGPRETLAHPVLEALGTAPERVDVLVAAGWAGPRDGGLEAAMVAAQAAVGEVEDKVGRTPLAARHPATRRTGEHRRIATAVEKDEALFAPRQPRLDRCRQSIGDSLADHRFPGIQQVDRGQPRGSVGPLTQHQQAVASGAGIRPAFQRRRGRAEDDRNAKLVRPEDGDITGRIAHSVLLLEGRVVFLIDDDQTQARQRREHREARAEHDARLAGERLSPVTLARSFGQFAVQRHRGHGRETGTDPFLELRGKVDLGDKNEGLTAGGQRPLN